LKHENKYVFSILNLTYYRCFHCFRSQVPSADISSAGKEVIFQLNAFLIEKAISHTEFYPFETSHKIHRAEEFRTSHRISDEALKRRDDLHYTMRSTKEKPELNDQLGELIAADIKNNIEAKRLSEYERYDVEPLTTTPEPSVLTTMSPVAVNEGLIDVDDLTLEEAGSENKQTSRIQIKKGPNGQEYEYEYVYYYYDDDDKNPGDDDVIIGTSRKGTPGTAEPTTLSTSSPQSSAGKSRYSSVERGSSAKDNNDIQSSAKARSQSLPPAPVVEEIVSFNFYVT
jgi:hypothetical protein